MKTNFDFDWYKVYLLYCGDAWLSTNSLVLMGVFTSVENAVNAVAHDMSKKSGGDYTMEIEEVTDELAEHLQTQGLNENWIIKECELNNFEEI